MTTSNEDLFRELGTIEERLKSLEKRQESVESNLGVVSTGFQQIEGGKKMALGLFAMIGACSGAIGAFITYMVGK